MQPASKYVVHSGHLMETMGFHLILTSFELFNPIVSCSLHLSQESYAYDNSCAVEVSFFLSMANSEAVTG